MHRRDRLELLPYDSEPEKTFRRSRRFFKDLSSTSQSEDLDPFLEEFQHLSPTLFSSPPPLRKMVKLSDHSTLSDPKKLGGHPGPAFDAANFEFKTSFVNMIERNQFEGGKLDDPGLHIGNFCDYCDTIKQTGITQDQVRRHMFKFSLGGKARQWFNSLDPIKIASAR